MRRIIATADELKFSEWGGGSSGAMVPGRDEDSIDEILDDRPGRGPGLDRDSHEDAAGEERQRLVDGIRRHV